MSALEMFRRTAFKRQSEKLDVLVHFNGNSGNPFRISQKVFSKTIMKNVLLFICMGLFCAGMLGCSSGNGAKKGWLPPAKDPLLYYAKAPATKAPAKRKAEPKTVKPKGPASISLTLKPQKDVNLDDTGNPLSVVVRIYYLSSAESFEKTNINDLWDKDKELLGSNILKKKELTISPASSEKMELKKCDGTQYIGIVAFFRKPRGQEWRKIIKMPKEGTKEILVSLSKDHLAVSE
jgi:type VI secretion system protein VasD